MKEKKVYKTIVMLILAVTANAAAESVRSKVDKGNELYRQGEFNAAIEKYDQAIADPQERPEPKFNKANSLYKLEDIEKAIELYKQIAASSSDPKIAADAKYNLGNSFFQKAMKDQQAEPDKTLDDVKTSISYFRDALDMAPENADAAQNIETAKALYKQLKQQQQQQQQDKNSQKNDDQQDQKQQDQQQQDKQDQQDKQEDKQQDQQDKQEDQQQQQQQQQDKQEEQQQQQPEDQQSGQDQSQPQQQEMAPDETAQQILEKEQQQKKERQILQSSGWQKVEKDW
ncbi:MAG: tetratricopeptide repeat protein [Sedimentisphaerales bacterium]|nr:tetratricopeptide repeat protein [Sedimentisphaerales bacterium]